MKKKTLKEKILGLIMSKPSTTVPNASATMPNASATMKKKPRPYVKKKTNKMTRIQPVTQEEIKENPPKKFDEPKKICSYSEHNCIAIQLANRLVSMLEEFEANIGRIENHPSLPEGTKNDIQNYINKNIVSVLWALSPAFPLLVKHPRYKTFKFIHTDAMRKAIPGILEEIKHI